MVPSQTLRDLMYFLSAQEHQLRLDTSSHTKPQMLQKGCRQSQGREGKGGALLLHLSGESPHSGISSNTSFTALAQQIPHALLQKENSDQTTAMAETDPEKWNPAPSGECHHAYPAGLTLHIMQASSALPMLKNTVQHLPAFRGSWSWQRKKQLAPKS